MSASSVSDVKSANTLVGDSTVTVPKPPSKFDRIVRCSEGHLYTTIWVPMVSLKALRFGQQRFQHCPVGHHWAMAERVDETQLSAEELRNAQQRRDARIA
ncbi:hypothetical protein GQ53DRAFT_829290 [Thozetella sp. PMI_491]|nr:hypothetical protein GQ53DRAFT_829290 [Thozetella sp. PMI_491]